MARPKQEEIPIEGPGVAPVKDKKLDNLCDKFIELRDERASVTEKMSETETKILDRMGELKVLVHRFADQIATIKPGKPHVKIKTVQADIYSEADSEGKDE